MKSISKTSVAIRDKAGHRPSRATTCHLKGCCRLLRPKTGTRSGLRNDSEVIARYKRSVCSLQQNSVSLRRRLIVSVYRRRILRRRLPAAMTAVTGKWKLTKSDNLENYHNAIHTTDEYKDRLRKLADAFKKDPNCYIEQFTYDASEGTLRRIVFVNGENKRETKHKVGAANDNTTADGRSAKITLKVESDSRISIHEKGADYEVNGFVEVKGDGLTLSLTGNGVTSVQTYTRV